MAVNNAAAIYNQPSKRIEPTKRTLEMVELLPRMRPDMWKATVKRFEGNEGRAKTWLGGYLQFWMNQVKDLIENAGKLR
ncbi:MAG: hypothetical protein FJZ01_08095 [Candidatus Sericytochromatia bacterium]|nr:hypothetical protein [Candidatus Tanganyikabacteria bacterium]